MVILCTVSVLFIVKLVLTNILVSEARSVQSLDTKINEITKRNADIRYEIASYSSLLVIEKKAKETGFEKTAQTMTLRPGMEPVALRGHFNP
jgi:cell division protein FtsL